MPTTSRPGVRTKPRTKANAQLRAVLKKPPQKLSYWSRFLAWLRGLPLRVIGRG